MLDQHMWQLVIIAIRGINTFISWLTNVIDGMKDLWCSSTYSSVAFNIDMNRWGGGSRPIYVVISQLFVELICRQYMYIYTAYIQCINCMTYVSIASMIASIGRKVLIIDIYIQLIKEIHVREKYFKGSRHQSCPPNFVLDTQIFSEIRFILTRLGQQSYTVRRLLL